MFGYVTVCKNTLSDDGYKIFKAYYCGLCKAIGKRCSQGARMGLSYDITFLAIVLSALDRAETNIEDKKCLLHPIRKNHCVIGDRATDYAADAGVMLSYLKLLDDWKDEKSLKALFSMILFKRAVKKARSRHPMLYEKIRKCLEQLTSLEKKGCAEIDESADCFARILEALFTPEFIEDEPTRRSLAWMGYNIGRWIYIMDAYNDLDADIKNKAYNTFAQKYRNKTAKEIKNIINANMRMTMTLTLENAASAYELLTVFKNKEVIDNIMFDSLRIKQMNILGEKNESL